MQPETSAIIHHPFSFRLGFLEFTGFGIAVLLAFVISQTIAQRELARRGHDSSYIPDLIFAAVIGGLLGAKLYFALVIGDLSDIFTRAGFVFWGGLMGGIALVLAVAWRKKLNLPRIMDVGGICIAAAYSVGRSGCWAVGDDYGRPWFGSRLAVMFPEGAPPSTAAIMSREFGASSMIPPGTPPDTVIPVHPTQIYEVVLGFVMFAILWRMRDHKHAEGWLFGVYCVMAGIERFIIEFFRAKDDRFFGPFTAAQMIALAFIIVGATWMWLRKDVGPGRAGIYASGARPMVKVVPE
jgi:phosphatidylglycerol:prolipoprotein diacylglycerol transferase